MKKKILSICMLSFVLLGTVDALAQSKGKIQAVDNTRTVVKKEAPVRRESVKPRPVVVAPPPPPSKAVLKNPDIPPPPPPAPEKPKEEERKDK